MTASPHPVIALLLLASILLPLCAAIKMEEFKVSTSAREKGSHSFVLSTLARQVH